MKVASIIGARPQFIKAAPVSNVLRRGNAEVLVHTGQHYDAGMSAVFFDELSIPKPDYNLGVGSGSHGRQTGQMLASVEDVLLAERPDWVLVYGDTNSTLAGALAAVKLHIPVAHVEAGLRSFNREMPEEHNRVLTDHCSDLLFCPTRTAVSNLGREGITEGVHLVGDVMYDAVLQFGQLAHDRSSILKDLELGPKSYVLATIHRPSNTDDPSRLRAILDAFVEIDLPLVFPVHPRTNKCIEALEQGATLGRLGRSDVRVIPALGYLDMLQLEQHARLILTDSGGVQKEAYFFAVPCVTLRPETEWLETVEAGWNVIVDIDKARILWAVHARKWPQNRPDSVFGDGAAAERIVEILESTPSADQSTRGGVN